MGMLHIFWIILVPAKSEVVGFFQDKVIKLSAGAKVRFVTLAGAVVSGVVVAGCAGTAGVAGVAGTSGVSAGTAGVAEVAGTAGTAGTAGAAPLINPLSLARVVEPT